MFFFRMVLGIYKKQFKKMFMIALTIMLGASVATAMLNVMLGVSDKINAELKSYGANISVVSKDASVLANLYEFDDTQEELDEETLKTAYIEENDVLLIKSIFWAYNITDMAPTFDTNVKYSINGSETSSSTVKVVGTWFNHYFKSKLQEDVYTGVESLRSWWDFTDGEWLDEKELAESGDDAANYVMVGSTFAKNNNISVGDEITLLGKNSLTLKVYSIYDSGDDDDQRIYTYMGNAQSLANMSGYVRKVEVSALTNPDDELSTKAAKNPNALSAEDYETWYCTAYVSSICYQIQEAIPDAVASAVRQVADSEGEILNKTQLLMTLIAILALIAAALGISNLVTSSVMERSQEIGLMKAVGAKNYQVILLVLIEILIVAILGAILGYFLGYGFAQLIGYTVFGSSIDINGLVAFLVSLAIIFVTLLGSIPAVRVLLGLRPTEVLHQR